MNPALMLLMRGSAAGGSVTFAHTDTADSAVDGTVYTFSDMSLGAAAAGRTIVAVVTGRNVPAPAISSVTIGGVTATIDETEYGGNGTVAVIARATVPTGATGDVVVTWATASLRCSVALWALPAAALVVANSTAHSSSTGVDESTVTLSGIQPGDLVVSGLANGNAQTPTFAWTGVTEDYDLPAVENLVASGGSATASGTSLSATATMVGGGLIAHVAAAYRAS